ncbi:MAG: saccharopine dehydrogenase NADP-binding domain-containing protein [Byssovorax sp.]
MQTLVVLGGTGVVGRRIARLAEERGIAERIVRVARGVKEDALNRRADLADLGSIRAAIAGASVVVNAVGPFTYDPAPLVAICAASGAQYVDIAEVESFRAVVAAQAGREALAGRPFAAVSGASTIPGLVELLARDLARDPSAARVRAYLSVGTRNPVSTTLLASMLDPLGRPLPEEGSRAPRAFASLVRKQHGSLGARLYGRYPSGARGVEVSRLGEVLSRTLPVEQYFGCDRAVYGAALWAAARALGPLPPGAARVMSSVARALAPLARTFGTTTGTLLVEVVDDRGGVLQAIELVARREGLDVPALPAVWAAAALGRGRRESHLGELVTLEDALADLVRSGVEIRRYGPGGAALGRGIDA